jgi:DNA-binding GntR family transcriptional regulator
LHLSVTDYPRDAEDWLYVRIAEDRLDGKLSDIVSEGELMRRYGTGRTHLQKILHQIAREDWIERRHGHGWAFKPMLNSTECYEAAYRFRALLEPHAVLLPQFRIDDAQWEQARAQQQALLDGDIFTLSRERLFKINGAFHEMIVSWSGNAYYLDEITQINRQRRLFEYRLSLDRSRLARQCQEHLQILDILRTGDFAAAARGLELHIGSAWQVKHGHFGAAAQLRADSAARRHG